MGLVLWQFWLPECLLKCFRLTCQLCANCACLSFWRVQSSIVKLSSPKSVYLHMVVSKGVDVCFVGFFFLLAVYLWYTDCKLQLVCSYGNSQSWLAGSVCIFVAFGDFDVRICKARQKFGQGLGLAFIKERPGNMYKLQAVKMLCWKKLTGMSF